MNDDVTRLAVPVGEDDHVRGPADAPVTLVEYADFECPYCREAEGTIDALRRRYGDRLRFVFRSFPLRQHRCAQTAAEAAEFAADHGRFWEMHDALFAHAALEEPDLLRHAEALGLDSAALREALRTGTYRALVDEVKAGGEESGIPGTPAFFLNGVLFESEPSVDALSQAIEWLVAHGSHR